MKILIVCQKQFGYHIDTFQYCRYLSQNHSVQYLCWDTNHPRQNLDGVGVIYLQRRGNIVLRNLRFIAAVIDFLRANPVDVCFMKYFSGCMLVKLFCSRTQFIFDIRTGIVADNIIIRETCDGVMRLESLFFPHVTVISQSLSKKLHLQNKAKILPLGSVSINNTIKSFDTLNLIYVGTLSKRNIEKTVIGFADFLKTTPQPENCSYTIIGSGYKGEEDQLRALTAKYGIESHVRVAGYIPFTKLVSYFARANIGVSFIPITPYFDVQPPTKTFDYLLSGMAVIGTATTENKLYINNSNGVLIDDSAESFKDGLHCIQGRMNEFSSETIRKNARQFHWQHIVHDLEEYLFKITRKGHGQNA